MDLKYFIDFLNKKVSIGKFLPSLQKEVQEYIKSMNNKKCSSDIIVSNQELVLSLTHNELIKLLKLYLSNYILEWDLDYILNVLDISGVELNDKVQEVIFNMSTPEINFPINRNNVNNCIKYLKGEINKLNLEPAKEIHYCSIFDIVN